MTDWSANVPLEASPVHSSEGTTATGLASSGGVSSLSAAARYLIVLALTVLALFGSGAWGSVVPL